mmetsp:Transcript_22783/g.36225  ORF Transcript_22783/g.36225 Transcript_22783/m.36225 type:complete len:91 (-) Transcript_22783:600-872(-)
MCLPMFVSSKLVNVCLVHSKFVKRGEPNFKVFDCMDKRRSKLVNAWSMCNQALPLYGAHTCKLRQYLANVHSKGVHVRPQTPSTWSMCIQ